MTVGVDFVKSLFYEIEVSSKAKPSHLDEITEEKVATIHHHLDIERIEDRYDAKIENIQPDRILQTKSNQATLDNF
jgi:hypothetical protein